jgi:hypothetical protein
MSLSQPIIFEVYEYLDMIDKLKMSLGFDNIELMKTFIIDKNKYYKKIQLYMNDGNNLHLACLNEDEEVAFDLINIYNLDRHNRWIIAHIGDEKHCQYFHAGYNGWYDIMFKMLDFINVNTKTSYDGLSIIEYSANVDDKDIAQKLVIKILNNINFKFDDIDELTNMMFDYGMYDGLNLLIEKFGINCYKNKVNFNNNTVFIILIQEKLFKMAINVFKKVDNSNYINHINNENKTALDYLYQFKDNKDAIILIELIINI